MDNLWFYFLIDLALLFSCSLVLSRELSVWHPLTHYLFYHGYVVTYRTWRLICGALPMNANLLGREMVTETELSRAVALSDLSLIAFTIGCVIAHRSIVIAYLQIAGKRWSPRYLREPYQTGIPRLLSIGLFALLISRFGFAEAYRGHVAMVAFWPIGCLSLGVYYYGFRMIFLVPIAAYLAIVGLQGFHRFMIIFPLIFLVSVYLMQNGRKWPSWLGWAFCYLAILLFPEWKYVGITFHERGFEAALERASVAFRFERENERVECLLDQLGGALTLLDRRDYTYYGATYLYFMVMPVPREWWPEKPAINQYVVDISTPTRPYSTEGRITTLVGESYANFRELGVALVPLVSGLLLATWCLYANSGKGKSIQQYAYLAFTVTFIQVFRDGLSSFVMFGVFQNVPLLCLLGLSWIYGTSDSQGDSVAISDTILAGKYRPDSMYLK